MRTTTWKRSWGLLLVTPMVIGCYEGINGRGDNPGLEDDADETAGDEGGATPDGADLVGPGECEDTKKYFEQETWGPVLKAKCFSCHNDNGAAKATDFRLQDTDYPGYLEANYNTVQNIARLEIEGTSLLLLKPSGEVDHVGGLQTPKDGDEYAILEEMVKRFAAPVHCVDDEDIEAYFQGIVEENEEQTLRKAVLLMGSRLPTAEEYDAVRGNGMEAVEAVLDDVMKEDAFFIRVREVFNDMMHTDALLAGSEAIDALDMERFPTARFYEDLPEEEQDQARDWANDAIAREPLHIIETIVREDRPFSEAITGNWTIINPYSARSYGIPLGQFDNANDPNEYVEHTFSDIPQAGVLSTPAFLARYPSTDTNRNRARSRIVYKFFLATDVMRLAARPIDIASVADFNPTLYNPQCNTCHDNVDPLAGAFQNWTNEGWYRPPETGWFPDMRPPGFGDTEIPYEETENALGWLASHLVNDPKFSLAVTHAVYTGLTGQPPLPEPLDADDPHYVEKIRAFEAQDWSFKKVAGKFENSNFNIKEVFKGLVVSPWFRAISVKPNPNKKRQAELETMGTGRLLSPEGLHRKLVATVGFSWQRGGNDVLLSPNEYLFFYGGIDSASVTSRLDQMNGVMVNIAERMANEVGCYATSNDFVKPKADRLLFPNVDLADTPETAPDKIKDNIVYLHEHLLGEKLKKSDPEVDRTWQLFKGVWADGYAGANPPEGESADYSVQLPGVCQAVTDRLTGDAIPEGNQLIDDPDYTVRAWMAVMTYLLGDYQFLYE